MTVIAGWAYKRLNTVVAKFETVLQEHGYRGYSRDAEIGAIYPAMQVFIFQSDKDSRHFAFTSDKTGSNLPNDGYCVMRAGERQPLLRRR